jgi:hypothetical protein
LCANSNGEHNQLKFNDYLFISISPAARCGQARETAIRLHAKSGEYLKFF